MSSYENGGKKAVGYARLACNVSSLLSVFPSQDEVARLTLMVCDHLGRLEPFLTKVLVNEVEAMLRGQIDVIFRGNSFPCKLLSQSFHTFGFYFLQSVLRPIVINLLQDREKRYEVDPNRLGVAEGREGGS